MSYLRQSQEENASAYLQLNQLIKTLKIEYPALFKDMLQGRKEQEELLVTAIKNGHEELFKFFLPLSNINSPKEYAVTPLIAAIAFKRPQMIEALLQKETIDVNKADKGKYTPLMHAVMKEDLTTLRALMEKGADIGKKNSDGDTLLHIAFKNNEPSFIKDCLATFSSIKEFADVKNIYGVTPLDLAKKNKDASLIKQLEPHPQSSMLFSSNADDNPSISQEKLRKKLYFYLKMQYRNTENLSAMWFCNGLTFLYLFYAAQGREAYFFHSLNLIVSWDGQENSLKKPFKDCPQATYYKNLGELLEQWANDIFWFQQSTLTSGFFHQKERLSQYKIVSHQEAFEPIKPSSSDRLNLDQFKEFFSYFMRMPKGMQLELGDSCHTTGGYLNEDGSFSYYDANFLYKTENSAESEEILQRITDYKHILFHGKEAFCSSLMLSCCNKDLINLKNFTLFKEEELCKTLNEAQNFQKNSPNGYTPLHLAGLTTLFPNLDV